MNFNLIAVILKSKTYVAGTGMILVGAGGFLLGLADPSHAHAMDTSTAFELVAGGAAAIGIGHKVEKAAKKIDESK